MIKNFLTGLLLAALPFCCLSQYQRPDTWFNIGYQYANFGGSFSPATIQMYQFNKSLREGDKPFRNDHNAYGLVVRAMIRGNRGLTSEFAIGNKKVISNASFFDSLSNSQIDVRTKQRIRTFTMGLHYSWSRFTVGGSVDLGMFGSFMKQTGGAYSGKYEPWFYTEKVFGSGITAKSPVVGWTISAGMGLTKYTDIRIFKQFTAFGMGATYYDHFFSLSNWGVELDITLGQ